MREIARRLNVSHSTISREIKRGIVTHIDSERREFRTYSADFASERHAENMTAKGPSLKIGCDHALVAKFKELIIDRRYSIAAARQRHIQDGVDVRVSQRTLYNYVYLYGFPVLPEQMVQGPHKPRRESVRKRLAFNNLGGVSIEQRPDVINDRSEVGHHEMDTVVGPRGTKGVLLVLTERQTRAEHILVMKDKTAASVCAALDLLEQFYGERFKELFKSITCDNGCEFLDAEGIVKSCPGEEARTTLYYAHPYCASERGSNENANRLIRRFLPKGTSLSDLKQEDVDILAMWINCYPRAIFGGQSSRSNTKAFGFHFRKKKEACQ